MKRNASARDEGSPECGRITRVITPAIRVASRSESKSSHAAHYTDARRAKTNTKREARAKLKGKRRINISLRLPICADPSCVRFTAAMKTLRSMIVRRLGEASVHRRQRELQLD